MRAAAQKAGSYSFAQPFSLDDVNPSVGAAWYMKQPDGNIQQSLIGLGPDDGSLTIESLGGDAVSGRITVHSKGMHPVHVVGTFDAGICQPPDAGADGG